MKVLVTGGTGFIGTHLCRELDARGHDVTALSRSPGDAGLGDGIETATGDVTAYDSIAGAFEGQDAVVNLVALSPLFKPRGGDEKHFAVHLEGTRNVVNAAEEHGVEALVQLSALGADPEGETAYIRAKGQAEDVVRESDLAWTIFRPSVVFGEGGEFVSFTETLTTPYVTALPGGGETRFQPIWVGDLVGMIADSLDGEHDGETYEVGGPEVLSLADVAKAVYREKGQSLTVLSVPMALAGVGMSLADPLPFVPFGSDQYRSLRFDNTVATNDVTAFGRDPDDLKRLDDYLRERR
ncbi:NADH dehydrogenase [Halarchaeum rubridurum]|uniref:NADH dehydrogenase n=1 Tax=Halarchaeum rubridurum TaxID=489911 RepID=A0A830FX28_9EURY|nr:complex I NDUFA9 subunit family protein [Halarchaeum rubridurum]MBP1954022.1 NADH dehydrogenase [Halarchaeum rubridurum]GGM56728.1 NADH dehydrogenase [Halarchaeum rubridurum]